jgi:hypothetical protein
MDTLQIDQAPTYRDIGAEKIETQLLFDAGLRMLYASNSGEARYFFDLAASAEPNCAMAHWGVALSFAISEARDLISDAKYSAPHAFARALEAVNVSPQNRRLIEASSRRFGIAAGPGPLRIAFAAAMREYVSDFPSDIDGLFISCLATYQAYGYSLLGAHASHLLPDLERVIEVYPRHEGARFLRICTLELIDRAGECTEDGESLELTANVPGLGHLFHRAAHVRWQDGFLTKAIACNLNAIDNNHTYFSNQDERYSRFMRGFNGHVATTTVYQLALVDRLQEAEALARNESDILTSMVLLRSRRWTDVLRIGPAFLLAQAIANAFCGNIAAARKSADDFEARTESPNFLVQAALVRAACARYERNIASEIAFFAEAYRHSTFHYDPPIYWCFPVAQGYGSALARGGRYVEAEYLLEIEAARTPQDRFILASLAFVRSRLGKEALCLPTLHVTEAEAAARELRFEDFA